MYYARNCGYSGLGATAAMLPDLRDQLLSITRTLRYGMSGPDVAAWQSFINTKLPGIVVPGIPLAQLATDGQFGPKTQQATMLWQKSKQLVADGIVGPKTKAAALESLPRTYPGLPGIQPVDPIGPGLPELPRMRPAIVTTTDYTTMPVETPAPKDNTGYWILGSLGLVCLAGGIIYLTS